MHDKIAEIVDKYINEVSANLDRHAADERYKFDALRHFQSTFNIDADDIAANLKAALSKVGNLAVGAGYYPVASICDIAANEPEAAREALRGLFLEDAPLIERMSQFQEVMAPLSQKHSSKTVSFPYNMDLRFMSLLLALHTPERNMYFKPTQVDIVYSAVYGEKTGTRAKDPNRADKATKLGEMLLAELSTRPEFHAISEAMGYPDDQNLWFAQDVIWEAAKSDSDDDLSVLLNKVKSYIVEHSDYTQGFWAPEDEVYDAVNEFTDRFSPEALADMSDDDLLRYMPFNTASDKDTMSYYLEHHLVLRFYGGIGGGSAGKMGFYQGNDGQWKDYRNKPVTREDALVRRRRDVELLSIGKSYLANNDYRGLRNFRNSLSDQHDVWFFGLVWVRKYFAIIFPDKYLQLYSSNLLKKLETVSGISSIDRGPDDDWVNWFEKTAMIGGIARELDVSNYALSNIVYRIIEQELGDQSTVESEEEATTMEHISQNTIVYGPPGTGKTYGIASYKQALLDNQQSTFEGLIIGSVKDTLLYLFAKSDNTPQKPIDIWRSEQFQKLQEYNGRTKSNASAIRNELAYDDALFERIDDYGIKYKATEEGLEYIRSIIEEQDDSSSSVDDFYQFITFHQSYGYEEFIEGIRAETTDNGTIRYIVRDGVFKAFCRRAESDPDNKYLFVIDEINRANISKVFGELITLIEPSKRLGAPEALTTTLPYSGETFGVPSNVYLLGTMNTADRSIALLDIALRRRFDFVELMPKPELLSSDLDGVNLQSLLIAINHKVSEEIDRNHQIGHSYLMGVGSLTDLHRAWYQRVVPLLQEYFYDDTDDLRSVLRSFVDGDEIVLLEDDEFKQALIGLYEEAQSSDSGIQL